MQQLALSCLMLLSLQALAESDISGSRDPLELNRYPFSWIVAYEQDDALLTREFVISRVDKTRRDVRVKNEVRVAATLESATYQMPPGTPRADLIAHYLAQLGAGEVFSCYGRDCGRSNHWANYIFELAILYGPDANQFYFAGEHEQQLVSLYIIERGNKRVYAHLRVLGPSGDVALRRNEEVVERLAGRGFSVIEGVRPELNGEFGDSALAAFANLAPQLQIFAGQEIYVVCHLYGSRGTDELLASAERCSTAAARALTLDPGPEMMPFGAGPLLPRETGNLPRIELVLPHRLEHR